MSIQYTGKNSDIKPETGLPALALASQLMLDMQP